MEMQEEFNQSPTSLSDQLGQLAEQMRRFSQENATMLSFDDFATLGELTKQAGIYQNCLVSNDWRPVITSLPNESQTLLDFLQRQTAKPTLSTSELNG